MILRLVLPIASAGPGAGIICVLGLVAAVAWVSWRFGPTLARVSGWCSFVAAWACGSQGGYGYCVAFALFGVLAWAAGTVWYAHRRRRWPSPLAARLFRPLFDERERFKRAELPDEPIVTRRR